MSALFPGTLVGNVIVIIIFIGGLVALIDIVKFVLKIMSEKSTLDQVNRNVTSLDSNQTYEKKHFTLVQNLNNSWVKQRMDDIYNTVSKNGKILFDDLAIVQLGQVKPINSRINFFLGTFVILGLLGTFIGMIISLQGLGDSSNFLDKADFAGKLRMILAGMQTAFITTIYGIVFTIFFGILNIVRISIYENFLTDFDRTTISEVLPFFVQADSITELHNAAEALKNIVIEIGDDSKVLKSISEKIDLNKTNLEHFVENFKTGTDQIIDYQRTIENLVLKIEGMQNHVVEALNKSQENGEYYSNLLESQNNRLGEIISIIYNNDSLVKDLHKEIKTDIGKIADYKKSYLEDLKKIQENSSQSIEKFEQFLNEVIALSKSYNSNMNYVSDETEKINSKLSGIGQEMRSNFETLNSEIGENKTKIESAVSESSQIVNKLNEKMDDFGKKIKQPEIIHHNGKDNLELTTFGKFIFKSKK